MPDHRFFVIRHTVALTSGGHGYVELYGHGDDGRRDRERTVGFIYLVGDPSAHEPRVARDRTEWPYIVMYYSKDQLMSLLDVLRNERPIAVEAYRSPTDPEKVYATVGNAPGYSSVERREWTKHLEDLGYGD